MQVYKVLKPFEFDGENVMIGTEIAVRAREAEKLMKDGFITPSNRELKPSEPKDKALIDKCTARAETKHEENHGVAQKESRQAEVDEREAQRDKDDEEKKKDVEEVVDESEEKEEVVPSPATPRRRRAV